MLSTAHLQHEVRHRRRERPLHDQASKGMADDDGAGVRAILMRARHDLCNRARHGCARNPNRGPFAIEVAELPPDRPIRWNQIAAPSDVNPYHRKARKRVLQVLQHSLEADYVAVLASRSIVGIVLPAMRECNHNRVVGSALGFVDETERPGQLVRIPHFTHLVELQEGHAGILRRITVGVDMIGSLLPTLARWCRYHRDDGGRQWNRRGSFRRFRYYRIVNLVRHIAGAQNQEAKSQNTSSHSTSHGVGGVRRLKMAPSNRPTSG